MGEGRCKGYSSTQVQNSGVQLQKFRKDFNPREVNEANAYTNLHRLSCLVKIIKTMLKLKGCV